MTNLSLTRALGPGRIAMALFGFNAVLPLLRRLVFSVVKGSPGLVAVMEGVVGLTTFIGVIFYLVWLHRVTAALRASGEQTRYTPGMAVGGWFIPFANFVLPMFSLGDVLKKLFKGELSWAAPAWWGAYVLTIIFRTLWNVPAFGRVVYGTPVVAQLVPWLSLAASVIAYGVWAFAIFKVSEVAKQHTAPAAELSAAT